MIIIILEFKKSVVTTRPVGHGSLRDGLFVEFTHNMRLYSISKETRLIAKSKFVPINPINSIIVPVEVFMRCLTEFSALKRPL